jgi:hypothetical protein
VKRIPDPDIVTDVRGLLAVVRTGGSLSDDEVIVSLDGLLEELDARGDAIAWLREGFRPARKGGRRWTRRARNDGRELSEKMEPRTQEVMYR